MYRRSWPALIIALIACGAVFLGFGLLYAYYNSVISAMPLLLIGIIFIAGGISVLLWYLKKRKK